MKEKVDINWTGGMSFDASVDGYSVVIDAKEEVGGQNKGPRPKPLLMVSLAGCTGMDVVSILRKMRVEFESLNVEVEGDLTEEHPKHYKTLNIIYRFKGKDLLLEKLEKAVTLSQERYCGVTAMLSKSSTITHEIVIEN